mgnify:FL=1
MRKKIFNIIFIFIIIFGVLGAGSVYAANTTKSNNTSNNTNTETSVVSSTVETSEPVNTSTTTTTETSSENTNSNDSGLSNHDIGLLAAALSTGLACVGAGIAVALVASSAIGAISENPSLLGKTIIFAGLAEGIAIYGLIISIMILNKV